MKAKEYLAEFKRIQEQTNDVLPLLELSQKILERFVDETKELLKKRNIQNKSAREALKKEMNDKWQILVRFNPKYFLKSAYANRILQEECMKEKPAPVVRRGVIDSMADTRELQKEALYKFRNLRNQK